MPIATTERDAIIRCASCVCPGGCGSGYEYADGEHVVKIRDEEIRMPCRAQAIREEFPWAWEGELCTS